MKRHITLIAAALTMPLLAGCAGSTTGSVAAAGQSRPQLSRVSPETVMRESLAYYTQQNEQARRQGKLITSGPEFDRVNAVMLRLVPQVAVFRPDAARWPWQLVLIDQDTVNAHVMAGGKITFYTGLIRKLKLTDDEIAAVMGHEMAHALREHMRERMSQNAPGGAAPDAGDGATQLAGLGKQLALDRPFSRRMETEADLYGLELAARAGYDPRAAVTLWQKMAQLDRGGDSGFLSIHPPSQGRLANLERAIPSVMPLYQAAHRGRS